MTDPLMDRDNVWIRPQIFVGRDLTDMVHDTIGAIDRYNAKDTRVFRYVDAMARVVRVEDEDGKTRARIKLYDRVTLLGELARCAEWVKIRPRNGVNERVPSVPSPAVAAELHGSADLYTSVPSLDQIVGCPIFSEDGNLQVTPGYSANTRTWFESSAKLNIPPVPERPNDEDVKRARSIIVDDLLGDFPFDGDADRAHAIGLLLTLITRRLFKGLVPMHGFDAPTEGTGKTLLVEAILQTISGVRPLLQSAPSSHDDAEWDKRITSSLLSGRQFIVWDNLDQRETLDSSSLAKLLTADTYGGRLLGLNKDLEMPNRLVSIYTGNNIMLSREMARRVVRCRLNAHMEIPSQGRSFRHHPLLPWIDDNRGEILWALYTLVRHWVMNDRVGFTGELLGSYEEWSRVVGGILDVAEITGFLGNRDEVYATVEETHGEEVFLKTWWDDHHGVAMSPGDANLIKLTHDYLGLRDRSGLFIPTKESVGKNLRQMLDRTYGSYELYLASKRPTQYAVRFTPHLTLVG